MTEESSSLHLLVQENTVHKREMCIESFGVKPNGC